MWSLGYHMSDRRGQPRMMTFLVRSIWRKLQRKARYVMEPRSIRVVHYGLGAIGTVFANNLIVGGGIAARIDGPYASAVWGCNLLWKTGGAGSMPPEGFSAVDPQLAADAAGILRPQAGSPVIDAAQGDFPAVTADLDGQPREGAKDIGADEVSTAPVIAKLLTPTDVGPMAKDNR